MDGLSKANGHLKRQLEKELIRTKQHHNDNIIIIPKQAQGKYRRRNKGRGLEVYSFTSLPVLSFAYCVRLRCDLRVSHSCYHAFPAITDIQPSGTTCQNKLFLKLLFVMVFHHSHRK